jgi:hypothetical protein
MTAPHPRVYSTNRLSRKSLAETFGPFPSRAAADRYCDSVLELFKLRRCYEDLAPYPEHPGCVYGEIGKCLMPCKEGNASACTPAEYTAEAQRVFAFFRTRGQSLLDEVAAQRDAASAALDFETAAALHKHWEKVRATSQLSAELIRPIPDLRAVILQQAAPHKGMGAPSMTVSSSWVGSQDADADVFLLESGRITGPERLSTLGVRAVREQTAVGSSLFAQPLMLAPVPLAEGPVILSEARSAEEDAVILSEVRSAEKDAVILSGARSAESKDPDAGGPAQAAETLSATTPTTDPDPLSSILYPLSLPPEDRARAVLATLTAQAHTPPEPAIAGLCDTLSLFRRWYYRPEKQRAGEVFLPNPDATWPVRRILNGAARVVLGPPTLAPPVDRDAAPAAAAALTAHLSTSGEPA